MAGVRITMVFMDRQTRSAKGDQALRAILSFISVLSVLVFLAAIVLFYPRPAFCESIENIIHDSETTSSGSAAADSPSAPGQPISPDSKPELNSAEPGETQPGGSLPKAKGEAGFAVQTGVFTLEAEANMQLIRLQDAGFEPYIFQTVNSRNEIVYAVRSGIFTDYKEAVAHMEKIRSATGIPAIVTAYDSIEPVIEPEKKAEKIADVRQLPVSPPASSAVQGELSILSLREKIDALRSEIEALKEESEARKLLQATKEEEEEQKTSEDILESAGREYTLTKEGNIKFTYSMSYSYNDYDAIKESARIEEVANHTLSNSFNVSYGLKDNFTLSTGIPFIYKYHHVGTVDSKNVTDLGDLSLNWQWQPIKASRNRPTIIINGGFTIPSGRSPYEINPEKDLSTGSGFYSASFGVSVSRVSDPVVVFSSFSMSYPMTVKDINQKRNTQVLKKVDPGMGFGVGMGMGYALSYRLYLSISFSYSYSLRTKYYYENSPPAVSGTSAAASLRIGTGYKLSPYQNLNFSIGIPITNNNNGFSISFSTPVEFSM